MRKTNYEEIRRRKTEGGALWFIERKHDGRWFHYTFERKDNLPCACFRCAPNGLPFKEYKDGWTQEAQEAQGYLTKADAEDAAFGYFVTDEPIDNLVITEHEFI